MSNLRRFLGPLIALSLLIPLLVLSAAPAAAQDDDPPPPITVFVLANVMTNALKADNTYEKWQVQVTVRPITGCVPGRGDNQLITAWLDAGHEAAASLSLTECVFEISAVVHENSGSRPCSSIAQLAWGAHTADSGSAEWVDGAVLTLSRPDDESRLSIRRKPGIGCVQPNRTHFTIRAGEVVAPLPAGSADAALLALARRAAEIAAFTVRVEPDYPAGAAMPPGCAGNTTTFTVRGDGVRVAQIVQRTGSACRLRASVVAAPAPFRAVEGRSVSFDGSGANILVDLSSLVRLPHARISIVQDVRGSANRGTVSYAIARSCGDATADPPPTGAPPTVALDEGRFTVHSPDVAALGPTAAHPVGAASVTSGRIVGCSVQVTAANLPGGCTMAGGNTQELTWTAADPIRHFDFEFDVSCGSVPPRTGPPGVDDDDRAAGEIELRIVARRLGGGRVEFGLQQRAADGSWGERLLPSRRFFPSDAPVGRWLRSSALALDVATAPADSGDDVPVRIVARRLSGGRVEFGLQQRDNGSWGERLLPSRRFFPSDAPVGRWLRSSTQSVAAA